MRGPLAVRFYLKVDKNGPIPAHRPDLGPCWVYTAHRCRLGYGSFWFSGTMHKAHRVAWLIEHGAWPDPCALHHCDNPGCVRPSHLFEGDQKANADDRQAKGRTRIPAQGGARSPGAKLTEEGVRAIRAALAQGETQPSIAARFGVTRSAVNSIHNGYTWSSLQ